MFRNPRWGFLTLAAMVAACAVLLAGTAASWHHHDGHPARTSDCAVCALAPGGFLDTAPRPPTPVAAVAIGFAVAWADDAVPGEACRCSLARGPPDVTPI